MDGQGIKIKKTFPGRYDCLSEIGNFIVKIAQDTGFDKKATYAVELAVDEACTNIIDHAYCGDDRGKIECFITSSDDSLQIVLRDFGKAFDPAKVHEPQINVPIEKLKTRGLGFYLIHKMMDEVHYQANPDGGNVMTLIKRK